MDKETIKTWANWIIDNQSDLGFSLDEFLKSQDKYKFLQSKRDDIRSIPNAPAVPVEPNLEQKSQELVKEYKSWDEIPAAYKRTIAKAFNLEYDDPSLKDAFYTAQYAMAKKQQDAERSAAEQEIQEGKERRTKEVENWPWYKKILASDYAKRRYIYDPDASIFGEEGSFNPYSTEGQRELGDLLYGISGGIADAIPGLGRAWIGPAIRGARDIEHKIGDSKYQKDWSDIAADVSGDLFANYMAEGTPSLMRQFNVAEQILPRLGKPGAWVAKQMKYGDFVAETANVGKGLKLLSKKSTDFTKMSQKEAIDFVETLPESGLKSDLQKVVLSDEFDPKQANELVNTWKNVSGKDVDFFDMSVEERKELASKSPTAAEFNRQKSITAVPVSTSKTKEVLTSVPKHYAQNPAAIVKQTKTAKSVEPLKEKKPEKTKKSTFTEQEMEDYLDQTTSGISNRQWFGELRAHPAELDTWGNVKKPEWENTLPVASYRYYLKKYGGK